MFPCTFTGASSGIGAETAKLFAELHCKIAINGRNEDALNQVADDCKQHGGQPADVLILPGDVTNFPLMEQLVEKAVNYFGKIDILVNVNDCIISIKKAHLSCPFDIKSKS